MANFQGSLQQEQLVFLREKVLAKLFSFATTGDVKAARLFLECTSGINEKKMNVTNNTQNNFIQINGKILTQDFF